MDDMLVKLFNEVEYVWPKVGYPPLVTPFSQYTKNIALMNLLTIEQGKGRYVMMDDAIWGMILGKSGKVPGKIDPEFVELAKKQNREFTDADPHTLIPNALDGFQKAMDENVLPLWRGKVKLVFSQLKESDAAILGASALAWEL